MNVCQLFINNPTVDPSTGERINIGDQRYNELVKLCGHPRITMTPKSAVPIVPQKSRPTMISKPKSMVPIVPVISKPTTPTMTPKSTIPMVPITSKPITSKPMIPKPIMPKLTIPKPIMSNPIIEKLFSIQKVVGAASLNVLKLNNRLIFLFGNQHLPTQPKCQVNNSITTIDFFDFFAVNSPACIDLFIEGHRFAQGLKGPRFHGEKERMEYIATYTPTWSMLSEAIVHYWCHFGEDKEVCSEIGNMRIHNIEFRLSTNLNYSLIEIFLSAIRTREDLSINSKDLMNLFDGFLNGDMKSISHALLQICETNCDRYRYDDIVTHSNYDRISKQFKDVPYSNELKRKLRDMFYFRIVSLLLGGGEDDDIGLFLATPIMDAYGLPRIIKSIYSYIDSRIIFVYAGTYHTKTYDVILREVYKAESIVVISQKPSFETCIDLDNDAKKLMANELLTIFNDPSTCSIKKKVS